MDRTPYAVWAAVLISACLLLAACSGRSHLAALPSTTSLKSSSNTTKTHVTTAPTQPPVTTSTTTPGPVPTLGHRAGIFETGSQGFGQVEPPEIYNGGDPTGLVTDITWTSWGGPEAIGSGTNDYVGPNQIVAAGTEETTTVIAFDLGTCDGMFMYQAVEWYFPQHGQSFNPNQYEDICSGTYVPSP
jgi:hypothetical protein